MLIVRSTLSHLANLFLKASCPLCQRDASKVVCPTCQQQLLGNNQTVTSRKPPTLGKGSDSLNIFAWGNYQGLLKQALTRLKYENQASLGVWLGLQLGNQWQQRSSDSTLQQATVVPIPLHQQRLQQRGYNQAALIAKGFCRATGLALAEHGLIRTKNTRAMHSLGAVARKTNLKQAFQLGDKLPPPPRTILLIDDIYTTGTTASSAAETLRRAGYRVPEIITVARTRSSTSHSATSQSDHWDQKRKTSPTL